ncbi:MAG: insulinase family protein [Bryobacterales bacterium]|nr:insulinase family protein [Bryobacterales bacterium]
MQSPPRTENVRSELLPNGITVVSEQMPHVRSVAVGIWVNAGSRHETAKQNGIAHFIEHMLFKGTANRSAEDIARETDSLGGNMDAFTSKELVCYSAKMLDQHLGQGFDILADLVLNPLFRPEDVEKEKGVILEELKMEVDNPEYLVHDLFTNSFWGGHAIGRPILGTKATIKSFNPVNLRAYYEQMYEPGRMVIAAAGNVTHEQFVELVRKYFGHLRRRESAEPEVAPVAQAPLILKNKRSLEQVQVCLGVPCNPLTHPMRYPSYVLATVLGGSMSSRLFQNIREKRGLAYSVFSEQYMYRDSGVLSVFAGTSLVHVPEMLKVTLNEFRSLKETPVPEDELRRSKDNLKGSLMLALESTSSRMSHIARQQIFYGRFATMDEIIDNIEAVRAEQLQQLANDFFQPERIGLTILGRLGGFQVERGDLVC